MKLRKFYSAVFLGYVLMLFIYSCKSYYKVINKPLSIENTSSQEVAKMPLQYRYFILRNGGMAYHMEDMQLSEDKKSITCKLELVPPSHQLYLINSSNRNRSYSKGGDLKQEGVLNEVHLYLKPGDSLNYGNYVLDLNKVDKIEIIEKDQGRTISNHLIVGIGVTLGVFLLVGIIAIATKSSCPFVSAYDGKDFTLQGEIYGGAIYPQLARHDYLALRMNPLDDGTLQIKITNELKERQYTDLAELWVVTHDNNSKVFADESGNLYSIAAPQQAIKVLLNNTRDLTEALVAADDNKIIYMDDTATVHAANEVYIKFNKPSHASKGKLMLTLKNSYFLDLLYGRLAEGFGNYYATYIKDQGKKPATELLKWVSEQQIPLTVSVKTTNGWKKITEITTVGPLSNRNMVVPIDLEDEAFFTEIKLSAGFMFWEIDQAAIDYGVDANFSVQKCKPITAVDEVGKNVTDLLLTADARYLEQPQIGNCATIAFKPSETKIKKGLSRSYFLHAKGYYEHIRNFNNRPDIEFLQQFKNPGAFPSFGLEVYKKMSKDQLSLFVTNN